MGILLKISKGAALKFSFEICPKQQKVVACNVIKNDLLCSMFLQEGNNFGDEYTDLKYCIRPVIMLKVIIHDQKILFEPSFKECRDIVLDCFSHLIVAAEGIKRVSIGKTYFTIGIACLLYCVYWYFFMVHFYFCRTG